MKKEFVDKYYIGLDIGSTSCGFAVVDENYDVVNARNMGKDHYLWGVRLFDEALTATDRRAKRTARRLVYRKRERILLLQELFRDEIEKIDNDFFVRLKLSSLWEDDKEKCGIFSRNSLFFDKGFNDKEFYLKYPTIYHLRRDLLKTPASDIRFLYLAVHNMLKHRGNFLLENFGEDNENSLAKLFVELQSVIAGGDFEFLSFSLDEDKCKELTNLEIFISENEFRIKWLQEKIAEILAVNKNSNIKGLIGAISGGKVNAKTIFSNKENELEIDASIDNFGVEDEKYLKFLVDVEAVNKNASEIIEVAKQIYSKIIFKKILGKNTYFAEALAEQYETHKKQLRFFKDKVMKKYYIEYYNDMFKLKNEKGEPTTKDNYARYVFGANAISKKKNISNKVSRADFYKYVKKVLESKEECYQNAEVQEVVNAIDNDSFLLKLRINENSIIPYQVNKRELEKILEVSSEKYPFLLSVDEDGLSVKDKIISILEYKIPYFVGPLCKDNSKNAWIEKRLDQKVLPWNIEKVVDYDRCEEEFIKRMQSNCTYLKDEKVLPKSSLLYSEYMILQELNNITVNGLKLDKQAKEVIMQNFKKQGKLTIKEIKDILKKQTTLFKEEDEIKISGVSDNFVVNMNIYKQFNEILNGKIEENIDMVENIIERATLITDKNRLEKWIEKTYGNVLDKGQIKRIKGIKVSDWARLSRKLLTDVSVVDTETGDVKNIIEIMREEPLNLMEIIHKYGLEDIASKKTQKEKLTYEDVAELYCSPSVKRGVWQSIKVVNEIEKILGKKPEKIFVEVTRHDEEKGKRTDARKKKVEKLYKKVTKDICEYIEDLKNELNGKENLNSDRLYLYFTQLGKCAYTGERIQLNQLNSDLYDIDHIIPQSKIKDDSFDNLVLVKRNENIEKRDKIIDEDIRIKQKPFWKMLADKGLFSNEKYNRLVRENDYTDDELKGFVNRQLVFTDQTVKAVIDLLKSLYGDIVVYSKAKYVSMFRNCEFFLGDNTKVENLHYGDRLQQSLIKCRDLNDLHHAKDAYLNIFVGNIMYEKYTKRFYNKAYLEDGNNGKFNILNAFSKDYKDVYIRDKHLPIILKNMESNTPTITFQARVKKGKFYKETIWGVDKHQKDYRGTEEIKSIYKDYSEPFFDKGCIPLKATKNPLSNTSKYGSYTDVTYSYFVVADYIKEKATKKGINREKIREFVAIPYMFAKDINTKEELIELIKKLVGSNEVEIIRDKIMVGSILKIGSGYFKIAGNSGNVIKLHNFNQLYLPVYINQYIKMVSKYRQKRDKNEMVEVEGDKIKMKTNRFGKATYLNKEENSLLFNLLVGHINKSMYKYVSLNGIGKRLKLQKENFKNLTIEEQLKTIIGLLDVINGANGGDLSSVGEAVKGNAGVLTIGCRSFDKPIRLISTSMTGYYTKEEDLCNGI